MVEKTGAHGKEKALIIMFCWGGFIYNSSHCGRLTSHHLYVVMNLKKQVHPLCALIIS